MNLFLFHPLRNLPNGRSRVGQAPNIPKSIWVDGKGILTWTLYNIPNIFNGIAEFPTRYASTQAVIADAYGIVFELVGETVLAFGHGSHKDADTLLGAEICHVVFNADDGGVETECNFTTIRGKMIRDRILDDFEEFFLGICRSNREFV